MPDTQSPARHTLIEDVQGLFIGIVLCSFGIMILTSAGLVTGQTAGVAVLLSYLTGYSFSVMFFLVNIPFYALALWRMGLRFTIKTFICVGGLSGLSALLPRLIGFDRLDPAAAAVLFGVLTGMGLLAAIRHGASLGGIGVVAVYMQDRFGFRAGWTQLGFDIVLFSLAFVFLDPVAVAWSLLGAVVLNIVIAINHRRDRYIAA